jgi:hypothetical protein|tara:strand:+ start:2388 stop:2501 length:114 start_codon:yes stop_codon:yes gene_type:complete
MLFLINKLLAFLNRPTDWRSELQRLRDEQNDRQRDDE